jgi:hypothetical protein
VTLSQARTWADNQFPGLQELHLVEAHPFTVTVFAKPQHLEEEIREGLRLQGAVFLFWKTGGEFRREMAMQRVSQNLLS